MSSPGLLRRALNVGQFLWRHKAPIFGLSTALAIPLVAWLGSQDDNRDFNPSDLTNNDRSASETFDDAVKPATTNQDIVRAIEEAVEESLSPYQSPEITADSIAALGVEGLRLNPEDNTIYYQDWDITHDGFQEILFSSEASGLPLSYSLATFASESSLDENALNSAGASGYGQLMPTTAAFLGYRYAEDVGFTGIENFVDRVNIAEKGEDPVYRYPFKNSVAENSIIGLAQNAAFNTRISSINKIRDIGRMQRSLAEFAPEGLDYYPVTEHQAYAAVIAGGGGGTQLLRDLVSNEGQSFATEFFSSGAVNNSINQNILFHPKTIWEKDKDGNDVETIISDTNNPRTVAEFYDLLLTTRPVTDEVLPDFTDSGKAVENFIKNLELAGIEKVAIAEVRAPYLSIRPRSRESGLSAQLAQSASPEVVESSGALETSMRPKGLNNS